MFGFGSGLTDARDGPSGTSLTRNNCSDDSPRCDNYFRLAFRRTHSRDVRIRNSRRFARFWSRCAVSVTADLVTGPVVCQSRNDMKHAPCQRENERNGKILGKVASSADETRARMQTERRHDARVPAAPDSPVP